MLQELMELLNIIQRERDNSYKGIGCVTKALGCGFIATGVASCGGKHWALPLSLLD